MNRKPLWACACLIAVLAGCGGDSGEPEPPPGQTQSQFERSLERSANVSAADFEAPRGRTLQELGDTVTAGPAVGLATSEYTPGENRLAFGLIGSDQRFVYGKTAVYLAPSPGSKARGPFPAPASSLVVDPPFRSRGSAGETGAIAAIYSTRVKLPEAGSYAILVVTKTPTGTVGAASQIKVAARSDIPAEGKAAPAVSTDTVASAGGDIESIETRVPPDDMHDTDLADALGKEPVALLFATPQLCQSRVCGPVTDIAMQLSKEYGDRMEFIHQEVYVDNTVSKGLRPQLGRFGLHTEPWLFTIRDDGTVAARLEGSFGIEEFKQAIEAAL